MNKRLVIIGASGHGKVVADAAQKMRCYMDIVFLDDNGSLTECNGFPVIGKSNEIKNYIKDSDIFVAIGNAATRQSLQETLQTMGASVPSIVHPAAVIGENIIIGCGTVVMAGAVINPGSTIGKGCIINTCSSVDHDCKVANFVHISVGAHLAGTVEVGDRTWVGAGVIVSNNVNICGDCMIGAGAVVIKNIEKAGTYVGIPAKRM